MATSDDPIPLRLPDIVPGRVVAWTAIADAHVAAQHSANTRRAYDAALRQWGAWCDAAGIDPLAAGRAHVQIWVDQLRQAGRRPRTIQQRLAAVRGAYQWAIDEELLTRNPAARVKGPRIDETSSSLGLSRAELDRYLDHADTHSTLAGALVRLLAFNGMRASEPCACDVADLVHERGNPVLRAHAKGGKVRHHPLAPPTLAALELYLDGRRRGPLFEHPDHGGRIGYGFVYHLVVRLADQVGLDPGFTPHSLRHTFVTLSLDAGVDLIDVQDAAGHADPRTTRSYDRNRNRHDRHPTFRVATLFDEE
ncbi:MAG: tyrosine-type recombinase/integrase [Acidimicrobiales bacterium]